MLLLTAVVDTLVALIFMGVSVAALAKFSISILISVSNWANGLELQSSTIVVPLFSFRRLGRSAFLLLAINCGDSQLLLPLQLLSITVRSITVTLLSSSTCSLSNTSEISFCKYREKKNAIISRMQCLECLKRGKLLMQSALCVLANATFSMFGKMGNIFKVS
jgi:hypothetical protein